MSKYIITLEKNKASEAFLNFVKSLNFILNIKSVNNNSPKVKTKSLIPEPQKKGDFSELFGLWKDSTISISTIREKAWPKRK
jgi:hypothetical protein